MRTSHKRIKLDRNCGDIADDLDSREWEVVGGVGERVIEVGSCEGMRGIVSESFTVSILL